MIYSVNNTDSVNYIWAAPKQWAFWNRPLQNSARTMPLVYEEIGTKKKTTNYFTLYHTLTSASVQWESLVLVFHVFMLCYKLNLEF